MVKKMHKIIHKDNETTFEEELNQAIQEGWKIVKNSFQTIIDSNDEIYFSILLEKDKVFK